MDKFRELTTFVKVAEEGAFSAAARALNVSPPAVTRLITSLETRIGARLFTRTTRQVALTDAGRRLLADASRILAELEEAENSAAGAHSSPRGLLRITAPVLFGQLYIAPILLDYLDVHPNVTAATLFVDRIVDIIDEGLDVAVRIAELPDSSLSAIRVGTVRQVVVAAPDYLAKHGTPDTLEDLVKHRIIHSQGLHQAPEWSFVASGKTTHAKLAPALSANTVATTIGAARSGWGITRALSYQVADALEDGSLIELLQGYDDRHLPIHLVHAEGLQAAAKTRSFLDFAVARIRAKNDLFAAAYDK